MHQQLLKHVEKMCISRIISLIFNVKDVKKAEEADVINVTATMM